MNKEKFILPVSIIIGCVILGWFYYSSEIKKQESIERQQNLQMDERRHIEATETTRISEEKAVRKECSDSSVAAAKQLLKTKAGLAGSEGLKEGAEKNLFLKEDFDKFYEDCLSTNGLKK